MTPTRRRLLLGGAALVTVGALELGILPGPAPGYHLLSPHEIRLVEAVGEALFPPGNPVGVSAAEVPLPEAVDELLDQTLAPEVGRLFRYTLEGLDAGTLVSRGRRFADLELAIRREVVATWASENLRPRRMAADALRMVLGMAFFNQPTVRAALGWSPPCTGGQV